MKIKQHLYWCQFDWQDEGEFQVIDFIRSIDGDHIYLGEIEVDVPDFKIPSRTDVAANKVDCLRKEKLKLQAETEVKLTKLEERIQSLLALPAEVEVAK